MSRRVAASLRDGTVRGIVSLPERTPAPGILVLHEITGIDKAIGGACDRLSGAGYVAFAPDLYSRGFKPLCIARTLTALVRNQPAPVPLLEDCLEWLRSRTDVSPSAVGAVGFCMGGGFALAVAVTGALQVAAVNYGGVPGSDDELLGVCPIVASYGGADRRFVGDGRRLEQILERLEVPHDVRIYDGATHSFMNSHRGRLAALLGIRYDPRAAEDAWLRTLDFFDRQLPIPSPT